MQITPPTRRQFVAGSVAAAAVAAGGWAAVGADSPATGPTFRGRLRKATIVGTVTEAALKPLKAAGFEGVETTHVCPEAQAAAGRAVAEGMGMRAHSVLRGWMEFNSDDPKKVEASLEKTRDALRAAKAYGADAILLVPCRIGGMAMPEPWAFRVELDEKSGHLTRVAEGADAAAKYEQYVKAHDRATDTSRAAVEKLLPLAEELKVVIGLENVWNNLWVDPRSYRQLVASFNSPWVRAYFDIGNHVKYSPPQEWIKVLGNLIVRTHVKDFKLKPDGKGGTFVHPRDGSIDWPAVRRALDEVGYDGWATIEDGGLTAAEYVARLELISAGR